MFLQSRFNGVLACHQAGKSGPLGLRGRRRALVLSHQMPRYQYHNKPHQQNMELSTTNVLIVKEWLSVSLSGARCTRKCTSIGLFVKSKIFMMASGLKLSVPQHGLLVNVRWIAQCTVLMVVYDARVD